MSEFVFFDGLNIRVCVFVMFGSIASLFQSIGVQTWNRAGLRWSAATAELPMQSLWDNTVPDKKSSIQEKVSVSVLKWSRTETRKVHFRINLDLRAINHSFSYSCSWWQLWFEKTLNSISSWKIHQTSTKTAKSVQIKQRASLATRHPSRFRLALCYHYQDREEPRKKWKGSILFPFLKDISVDHYVHHN